MFNKIAANFQLTCYGVFLLVIVQSSVESYNFGLKSPIEVVEEWGCFDSEIRLTCGHLDSKIAILEAIFTPNCTDDDCYRIDFRRLMRAHKNSKRTDPRVAETEAGRRFLESLRKADFVDEEFADYGEAEGDPSNKHLERFNDSGGGGMKEVAVETAPRADFLISHKKKRTSLRASLERLIIKYLKKLSPNIDLNYELQRRRSLRIKKDLEAAEARRRVQLGSRNITVSQSDLSYTSHNGDKRYRKVLTNRSVCLHQRRKITALGRFDIEKAVRNESTKVHNIRATLNRRCSGRNHCSFLFAVDYPYALLWNNGSIYLKYVCMEEFRANRYCGEHLIIGNEVPAVPVESPGHIREKKGEPKAEARQQPREQGFHSLKIIKTSGQVEDASMEGVSKPREGRRRRPKFQQLKANDSEGVYSQDFRVLKILPNNLDDVKDIEKVANQIYFHKDVSPSAFSPTQDDVEVTSTMKSVTSSVLPILENPDNQLNNHNVNPTENITIIIREGEKYVVTYPQRKLPEIIANTSEISLNTLTTLDETTFPSTEGSGMFSSSIFGTDESPLEETTDYVTEVTESLSTVQFETIPDEIETIPNEIETIPRRKVTPPPSERLLNAKYENRVKPKQSGKRTYNSTQRTMLRDPLLQGFTMTPGYPKFYVGNMECNWRISAPIGQKIRLTILDLSLRYDPVCKDYLEVTDLDLHRTLFNSCNETMKPLQIISDSNRIQVKVKTTTKFAYPKRGVLIHYSALGCLTPNPPLNGRLVERTEYTALFECEAGYIFPDTAVSSRRLECENNHDWNNSLPDCIEKVAVSGRDSVSVLNLHIHKKLKSTTKPEMGTSKDADMVNDVIIPSTIIAGLFIVNAIILVIILRYRKRRSREDMETKELAEL